MTSVGSKVKLIFTNDEYTRLKPGAVGVVNFIDDMGTRFVKWEDGSNLGLIPGVDRWEVISSE